MTSFAHEYTEGFYPRLSGYGTFYDVQFQNRFGAVVNAQGDIILPAGSTKSTTNSQSSSGSTGSSSSHVHFTGV